MYRKLALSLPVAFLLGFTPSVWDSARKKPKERW